MFRLAAGSVRAARPSPNTRTNRKLFQSPSRMKRSLPFHSNAIWPPAGMAALFVIFYAMVDAGLWIIARAARDLRGEIFEMTEIRNFRALILGTAAGCYAFYRLWRFHPFCNRRYSA